MIISITICNVPSWEFLIQNKEYKNKESLLRMEHNRMALRIMQYKPGGYRHVGGPRRRWGDSVLRWNGFEVWFVLQLMVRYSLCSDNVYFYHSSAFMDYTLLPVPIQN
jgi:hypothetical protein